MLDFLLKKADIDKQEYKDKSETRWIARIRILTFLCAIVCFTWFNAARAVVGAVAVFFLILPRTRRLLFKHRGSKIAAVFIAYAFIVATCYLNILGMAAALMFMGMLVVTNTARCYMSRGYYEGLLDAICLGSLFPSIWCIIEKYIVHGGEAGYRSQALFNNPNFYGAAIMIVIVVCAYKVATLGRHSFPYIAIALVNAFGLLAAGSMSLWLIAFIAVVILLILTKRFLLLGLLISAAATVLLLMYFVPDLFGRLDEIGGTTSNRMEIWSFAIEKFKETPIFGRGFSTYRFLYDLLHESRYIYKASYAHSIYLEALLCHGVVGTSMIIGFFTQYMRDLLYHRKRLKKLNRHCARSALVLSLFAAIAVYGLIDTTLVWIQGGTILLLITTGVGVEQRKADHAEAALLQETEQPSAV